MIEVRWNLDHPQLLVGIVQADGVRVAPSSPALLALVHDTLGSAASLPGAQDQVRAAIRDVFRRGGFKPTGRSKPASEYLAKAAQSGSFPEISNLVDINNLLSIRTGWPMSILDTDRATGGGDAIELRMGHEGESYVFNPSGQAIDVRGLPCVAIPGGPAVGGPVKDSMLAKTTAETTRALAVIYASSELWTKADVAQVAEQFAALLKEHAGADRVDHAVLHQCNT